MASGFVSSSQLDEEREKRQTEWEKVRKPEDPAAAPEPEVCNKTLFEQLRDNREVKEAEQEEAKKFKNMIRGIDEDESEFLSQVDDMKNEALKRKKQEEQELLRQVAEARGQLIEPVPVTKLAAPVSSSSLPKSKQASILSSAIKRKSTTEESSDAKIAKKDVVAATPAMSVIGSIPGMGDYEASSDSASDSSDEDVPIIPMLEVSRPEKSQDHEH